MIRNRVARLIAMADKPCWTYGEAALFMAAWLVCGAIGMVFWQHGHRWMEAAITMVVGTSIAVWGNALVRHWQRRQLRAAENLVAKGVMTVNQARADMGLQPWEPPL